MRNNNWRKNLLETVRKEMGLFQSPKSNSDDKYVIYKPTSFSTPQQELNFRFINLWMNYIRSFASSKFSLLILHKNIQSKYIHAKCIRISATSRDVSRDSRVIAMHMKSTHIKQAATDMFTSQNIYPNICISTIFHIYVVQA